ncbi:MAG: cell division protein ZapA, partial [Eubacteriales bacterium]|jgi:cell division protein ZapA|nr:cell division protein ZapA [Eubacteriales bacterium]
MSKNRVTVAIAGKEYTVLSSDPVEHVGKVAKYLDEKISALIYNNSQLTIQMATVLAAINITDEYFKSVETADNLRQQVAQYIDDVSKDRAELTSLRAENERLKKQLARSLELTEIERGQQSIL